MSDTAIAMLLASHDTDQAIREEIERLRAENVRLAREKALANPPKAKGIKAKKVPTHSPNPLTANAMGLVGVMVGTMDPKSFLIGMRKAPTRDEQVKLIHAYCGYDTRGDFGTQDIAARSKAQRELLPHKVDQGPTREEQRAASRSMTGFVAGMPDHQASQLSALQAREAETAEAIIDLEKRMAASPALLSDKATTAELNRLRCLLSNVQDNLRQFGG